MLSMKPTMLDNIKLLGSLSILRKKGLKSHPPRKEALYLLGLVEPTSLVPLLLQCHQQNIDIVIAQPEG